MDRFFKHERMPGYGQVRVFDRSWYEEVLVVRVNKIKPEPVWQAAYSSLRTLDWMLEAEGAIVVKIWTFFVDLGSIFKLSVISV